MFRASVPLVVASLGPIASASCSRDPGGDPGSTATASSAAASASAARTAAPAATSSPDDEVRPVYPVTRDPPHPLAARLCDVLHALPAKRRAACCGGPAGFHPASECARTLSFALRSGAVTLASADVDSCVEAAERSLQGCDWVTSLSPPPPAACEGILKGTLPEGAACRSSLECSEGLRCVGVGPTDMGRCAPPRHRGACGLSVDTLAAHTRQTRFDLAHPECVGHCATRACADDTPLGGACRSHVECGRGRHCAQGRCTDAPSPATKAPAAYLKCPSLAPSHGGGM